MSEHADGRKSVFFDSSVVNSRIFLRLVSATGSVEKLFFTSGNTCNDGEPFVVSAVFSFLLMFIFPLS